MTRPSVFDELYPGRFIKAGLLKGRTIAVTIEDVFLEELEGEKGKEQKAILSFTGKTMQLVLCKLNGLCLKAMFGPSVSAWKGKRIFLWPTATVMAMHRGEECIRIWGSPDLAKDQQVSIQLPRRKAFSMTMHREIPASAPAAPAPPPPAGDAPAFDASEFPETA